CFHSLSMRVPPANSRCSRAARYSALTEKFAHPLSDETAEVFECEVASIDQVQFRVRNISLVSLGSFNGEERIVFSPENEHSRLPAAEVLVPTLVEREVRLIVVKKIQLNRGVPRTLEKELVHRIRIRVDAVRVCNSMCVLKNSHFFRQKS